MSEPMKPTIPPDVRHERTNAEKPQVVLADGRTVTTDERSGRWFETARFNYQKADRVNGWSARDRKLIGRSD